MSIKSIISLAALGLGMAISLPASAEVDDNALGANTYLTLCATCHGALAHGDGPLTELMLDAVPDLHQLSARNNGVFPMLEVMHIVDGRTGLRGHGGPMPVYGALFSADAFEVYGAYGAEAMVRGRILSLVYYLESIQE